MFILQKVAIEILTEDKQARRLAFCWFISHSFLFLDGPNPWVALVADQIFTPISIVKDRAARALNLSSAGAPMRHLLLS